MPKLFKFELQHSISDYPTKINNKQQYKDITEIKDNPYYTCDKLAITEHSTLLLKSTK